MKQLTLVQQEVLFFIRSHFEERGMAPTCSEIAKNFGWADNNAYLHVQRLVKKGVILQERKLSRGIRLPDFGVVDLPDASDSEYWFEGVFQHQRYQRDAVKSIHAAGMKVKGTA